MTTYTLQRLTAVPFDGFCDSEHDAILEQAIEQMFQDDSCDLYEDLYEEFTGRCGYTREMLHAYCLLWLKAFNQHVLEKTGTDLKLAFNLLVSPLEYNFETDRIIAEMPFEVVDQLSGETPAQALQEVATARFTSRSGFVSFYSPDIGEWPYDLVEWDPNQIETLLIAWLDFKGVGTPTAYELLEDAIGNGQIDDIVVTNVPEGIHLLVDQASNRREAGVPAARYNTPQTPVEDR